MALSSHAPVQLGWRYFRTRRIRESSSWFWFGCCVMYFALPTFGIWARTTLTVADYALAVGLPLFAGALFIFQTILRDGETLTESRRGSA